MSAKEDFIAAMQKRTPARVPIWELEFHCWDAASGRHVVLGREFEALTPAEQERALHANAEIILSVCRDMGFAALTIPGNYWEVAPGQPAYWWLPGDWRWRQAELLIAMGGKDLVVIGGSGGIIGMPGAQNYAEFCYKVMDAPEEIDEWARQALAGGIEKAKRLRDLGCEAVFSASDFATNHGPFFSPPQMRRWIYPQLRAWGQAMRELGLYSILHTDGDITPCLEEIADTGIDAVQAIDPIAGMDIRQARRIVGNRLCLCGNVDCGLLQFGPAEKIYQATRALLRDLGPQGAFVLGASNAVFVEMPIEHYRAMIQAWKDSQTG